MSARHHVRSSQLGTECSPLRGCCDEREPKYKAPVFAWLKHLAIMFGNQEGIREGDHMETLTILLCEAQDASHLALLMTALAREEGSEPAEYDKMVGIIEHLIETSASDFLLAMVNREPVGCVQIAWRVSTWHAAAYAYLEDVYVIPARRGQGVGRRMVMEAMSRVAATGADQIMLDVRTDNLMAQRLYERLGFKNSGSMLMKHIARERHVEEAVKQSITIKDKQV